MWALAIDPDGDSRKGMAELLAEGFPGAGVEGASNIEEAQKLLISRGLDRCCLVLSTIRVPRSLSDCQALSGSDLTSLELVKWIRSNGDGRDPPIVLVASYADADRAAEIGEPTNVAVIRLTIGDFAKVFRDAVERLLKKPGDTAKLPPLPMVDLDIHLKQTSYSWRLNSVTYNDTGALDIQHGDIDDLRGICSVKTVDELEFLSGIGARLYRVVMNASTDQKGTRLGELLEKCCGRIDDRARIRFIVDDHTYPILLEAVAEPPAGNKEASFWMLRTPIFRRYEHAPAQKALFNADRERRLNCLLIQGRVDGFSSGAPLRARMDPIVRAREEIDELESLLKQNRERFLIGDVEVVRYGDKEALDSAEMVATIERKLGEREWDLVHYAGHSVGKSAGAGRYDGYLVIGEGDLGTVAAVDFARWAEKSRFVYFSSCQSAGAYFVVKLVEQTVPAILGFRWPVEDGDAKFFAQSFYQNLFEKGPKCRQLEHAFLNAKRALHGSARGQQKPPVWAAPMLVMQLMQSGPN